MLCIIYMPNQQALYKLQEKVTKINLCCAHTLNRILSVMKESNYDSACQKELKSYADCCVTLEQLSKYVSTCCCHTNVSTNCSKELKTCCSNMKQQCMRLKKHLNAKDYKFVNCAKMIACC